MVVVPADVDSEGECCDGDADSCFGGVESDGDGPGPMPMPMSTSISADTDGRTLLVAC